MLVTYSNVSVHVERSHSVGIQCDPRFLFTKFCLAIVSQRLNDRLVSTATELAVGTHFRFPFPWLVCVLLHDNTAQCHLVPLGPAALLLVRGVLQGKQMFSLSAGLLWGCGVFRLYRFFRRVQSASASRYRVTFPASSADSSSWEVNRYFSILCPIAAHFHCARKISIATTKHS